MRPFRAVIGWLPLVLLTTCIASHPGEDQAGAVRPTVDRLLNRGDIQVAQRHLQAFGFDPGPIDGIYTVETQAAVRAFQATYGFTVSGLLDRQTREVLRVGVDPRWEVRCRSLMTAVIKCDT
jgi:murein L,D-transpeptidase YcbB/YkuD